MEEKRILKVTFEELRGRTTTDTLPHHRQTTIVIEMESSSGKLPQTPKVPFLLKFNINTQLRYLNTQDSDETFTDHLGVAREVHTRNDITVNRAMFILGGYIFDQRARYSFTVWTSAGAASIVVASNIGWQFNKALTLTGGYTGVPGSRSLVNTFPFLRQPTGAWRTTSSAPASPRASGRTENP